MNRAEILEAASKAVHAEDKDHDYGSPEDNFGTIAKLWTAYLDASYDVHMLLDGRDVAAMMVLLKIARVATSEKADNWIDIAGYGACGGEIDTGGEEEKETVYADNKEVGTIVLKSLGDVNGPFELKFTIKKEDE